MSTPRRLQYQDIVPEMKLATSETKDTVRAGVNGDEDFPKKLFNFKFRGTRNYNMECLIVGVYAYCLRSQDPVLKKFVSTMLRGGSVAYKLLEAVKEGNKEKIKKWANSLTFLNVLGRLLDGARPKRKGGNDEDWKIISAEFDKKKAKCVTDFVNQACKINGWIINGKDVESLIDKLRGVRETQFKKEKLPKLAANAGEAHMDFKKAKKAKQLNAEINELRDLVHAKQSGIATFVTELESWDEAFKSSVDPAWRNISEIESLLNDAQEKQNQISIDFQTKLNKMKVGKAPVEEQLGKSKLDFRKLVDAHSKVIGGKESVQKLYDKWRKRLDDLKDSCTVLSEQFKKVLVDTNDFRRKFDLAFRNDDLSFIFEKTGKKTEKLGQEFKKANEEWKKIFGVDGVNLDLELQTNIDKVSDIEQKVKDKKESIKEILTKLKAQASGGVEDLAPSEVYVSEHERQEKQKRQEKAEAEKKKLGSEWDLEQREFERKQFRELSSTEKAEEVQEERKKVLEEWGLGDEEQELGHKKESEPEPKPKPKPKPEPESGPDESEETKNKNEIEAEYESIVGIISAKDRFPINTLSELVFSTLTRLKSKVKDTDSLFEEFKQKLAAQQQYKKDLDPFYINILGPSIKARSFIPLLGYKLNGTAETVEIPTSGEVKFTDLVRVKLSKLPKTIQLKLVDKDGAKPLIHSLIPGFDKLEEGNKQSIDKALGAAIWAFIKGSTLEIGFDSLKMNAVYLAIEAMLKQEEKEKMKKAKKAGKSYEMKKVDARQTVLDGLNKGFVIDLNIMSQVYDIEINT